SSVSATHPKENDRLGREITAKAKTARGPTAILLPLRGVSAIDAEGQPFWWPEADEALFESIRREHGRLENPPHGEQAPQVRLIELDAHINDPVFAETAARTLLELI